jgi:hypothetical protein
MRSVRRLRSLLDVMLKRELECRLMVEEWSELSLWLCVRESLGMSLRRVVGVHQGKIPMV